MTGIPPWPALSAPAEAEIPTCCDVAIIGAGLAGVTAALLLAREGVSVVVLEAEARLGEGCFGRGPGIALGWLADHPHRLEGALGVPGAQALQEFIAGGHRLAERLLASSGWRTTAGLHLPGDAREAGELALALACEAPAGHALTAEQLRREQGLNVPLGGQARKPAATVEPRRALDSLAHEARAAGARIACGRRVEDVDDSGARPVLRWSGGRLEAELTLFCGGLGAAALEPVLARWLQAVHHGGLRVELPDPVSCSLPLSCWYGQLRARPLPDGSWVLAGGRLDDAGDGIPPRVEAGLVSLLAGMLGQDPAGLVCSHRWLRTAAHSRDGLPLVGPVPGRVRRILCAGFADGDPALEIATASAVCGAILGGGDALPEQLRARRVLGV